MILTTITTITTTTYHPVGHLLVSIVVKITRLCQEDTCIQIPALPFAGGETLAKQLTFQASVLSSVKWKRYHPQTYPGTIRSEIAIRANQTFTVQGIGLSLSEWI